MPAEARRFRRELRAPSASFRRWGRFTTGICRSSRRPGRRTTPSRRASSSTRLSSDRGRISRPTRGTSREISLGSKRQASTSSTCRRRRPSIPPDFETWVVPGPLAEPLEGARRPGHFRGVLTVVAKLFHVIEPDRAYFGQKDAQQAILVRRMTADLDVSVGIVVCPIVRDRDGLALSSRNVYLTPDERRAAPVLYSSLRAVAAAWGAGERRGERLREIARAVLATEPLAAVDYVSAADPETLAEIETATGRLLLSIAVRFGTTRLLDNVLLPENATL